MGAKAQVEFGFGGIRGGIKDLGDLRDALIGVEGAGKRLDASYKGLRNLFEDPAKAKGGWSNAQRAQAGIVKMAAEAVASQATAAAQAITGPAKSSYEQVLAKGRDFRDSTQRIATASGQNFETISGSILNTSKRLGVLPGQVDGYARSVRAMTGDWDSAIGGMDAFQNRALKTDRTIEQMIPTAITLADTFGAKSTGEVNKFFGTLDAQAKNAKISAEVAERAFMAAAGMLSRISGAGPQQLGALTTQVIGNAKAAGLSAEQGQENLGEVGGFLAGKQRFLERKAIQKGLIKKGEHLTKGGRYTEQGGQIALEVAQAELPKFYRTKDKEELIGRMAESGLISPTGAAALLDVDPKRLRRETALRKADDMITLEGFLASPTGRGAYGEVSKDVRDIQYGLTATLPGGGSTLLEKQDKALLGGGGAGGIVQGSINPVASVAVNELRAGDSRAEQYEAELARRRAGTSRQSKYGHLFGGLGSPSMKSDEQLEDQARAARGFSDIASYRQYRAASGNQSVGAPAGGAAAGYAQTAGPIPVTMDLPALGRTIATELAKALGSTTVRTQPVEPPKAPPGQSVNL